MGNVRSPTNGFYWNPWLDLQLGDGVVFMSKTFRVPYCMCALVGLCRFPRAMPLGVVECTWNIAPATPVQVFKPKLYQQLLTSVFFKGTLQLLHDTEIWEMWQSDDSISDTEFVYLQDLGAASQTKRPTSIVLVKSHEDFEDNYKECFSEVKSLPLPL